MNLILLLELTCDIIAFLTALATAPSTSGAPSISPMSSCLVFKLASFISSEAKQAKVSWNGIYNLVSTSKKFFHTKSLMLTIQSSYL